MQVSPWQGPSDCNANRDGKSIAAKTVAQAIIRLLAFEREHLNILNLACPHFHLRIRVELGPSSLHITDVWLGRCVVSSAHIQTYPAGKGKLFLYTLQVGDGRLDEHPYISNLSRSDLASAESLVRAEKVI